MRGLRAPGAVGVAVTLAAVADINPVIEIPIEPAVLVLDGARAVAGFAAEEECFHLGKAIAVTVAIVPHAGVVGLDDGDAVEQR